MHKLSEDPMCILSCDFVPENVPDYLFITFGSLIDRVARAKSILSAEGLDVGIILVETIKPYDGVVKKLIDLLPRAKRVVYAEEGIKNGGAAEITLTELINLGFDPSKTEFLIAAIEDNFASPTKKCDLYDYVELSPEKLAQKMRG